MENLVSLHEIFMTYARKRLEGDSVVLKADFPSSASPSLFYLSRVAKVDLLPVENMKWVRDEDDIQPERYQIEDISFFELAQKRGQNINNIVAVFPDALALKIEEFEAHTKYLYSGLDDEQQSKSIKGLKAAKKMFSHDKNFQKMIQDCIYRISPSHIAPTERRKQRAEEKKKMQNKRFYEIIPALHATQNPFKKIELYKELLTLVGKQNYDLKTPINGGKARVNLELKRDIYAKLSILAFGHVTVTERYQLDQAVESYNKKLFECLRRSKKKMTETRNPLGLNGAFNKGGLYGSDSPFAKIENTQEKNENEQKQTQPKIVDLLLFTDKDFEY